MISTILLYNRLRNVLHSVEVRFQGVLHIAESDSGVNLATNIRSNIATKSKPIKILFEPAKSWAHVFSTVQATILTNIKEI